MSRESLFAAGLVLIAASGSALGFDRIRIGGSIGTAARSLEASGDYTGAVGYVAPDAPTGKMGSLDAEGKPSFGLSVEYKLNDRLRTELSYARFNYGTTRWGTDFDSYNGAYDPALAIPFVGKLHSQAYFVGLNYEGLLTPEWTWHVGAAVGQARNTFEDAQEGDYGTIYANTKREFAYKLAAGVGYRLAQGITVVASVWLVDIGSFESARRRSTNFVSTESISPYKFDTKLQPIGVLGLFASF